jgi:hypothetical protein
MGEGRPSPEMMAEIQKEIGKEAEPRAYTLEADPTFLDFKKVEVTAKDETKPWKPATKVRVERADGSVMETSTPTHRPSRSRTARDAS